MLYYTQTLVRGDPMNKKIILASLTGAIIIVSIFAFIIFSKNKEG